MVKKHVQSNKIHNELGITSVPCYDVLPAATFLVLTIFDALSDSSPDLGGQQHIQSLVLWTHISAHWNHRETAGLNFGAH